MGTGRPTIRLFGAFQLLTAQGDNVPLPTRKARGLLAYLIVHQKQPQERAKLAGLFWEDSDEERARESLRQTLALLRRALPLHPERWLISQGDVIAFEPSNCDVDVHRFLNIASSGEAEELKQAAELYRGEFLDGFEIRSTEFESWLSSIRQYLNEKALACLGRLLSHYVSAREIEQGITVATKLLHLDPLRESLHRQLMEFYCRQGRYNSALRQYRTCAEILARELGVEPDAATKASWRKIREQRNRKSDEESESKRAEAKRVIPKIPPQGRDLERRQITVIACEFLGIDEQLERGEPESLLFAAKACFQKCREIVARFGGHIGRFSGNGFPAYFGYPRADEHSSERAVRAGLALLNEIELQDFGLAIPIRIRVGIAAGPVVVGDFAMETDEPDPTLVGEAPKQAAILQSIAAPQSVLISDPLRRRVGELFDYQAVSADPAPSARPAIAWRVLGESSKADRFAALRGANITKFVGRGAELQQLHDIWRVAEAGEGRIALILGEAGIGKSRLIRGFEDRITAEPHLTQLYHCSPFHTNTPLHPFIQQIERAAGFEAHDEPAHKRLKLAGLLGESSPRLAQVLPIMESLLGIAGPAGSSAPAATPAQRLRRTLAALLTLIETLSRSQPLLLVFEDLHWADATSLELLDLLAERIRRLPVLAALTSRPGLEPSWQGLDHVSVTTVAGLSASEARAMVNNISGEGRLPCDVIEHILGNSDGIPLYVEELAKVAVEGNAEKGSRRLGSSQHGVLIPATLQDSLLARLDGLGPGKEVAQMGAVIGREFSCDLLAPLARLSRDELEAELSKLADSGLIHRRGSSFMFKHALIQDAAYQSLSKSRREQLHASLARALALAHPDHQPEILAHHYSEANMPREALPYWLKAGRLAADRSAIREAIGHVDRALAILTAASTMSEQEKNLWEVRFLSLKGPCVMSLYGYGAQESQDIYERAHNLIDEATPFPEKLQIICGLWNVRFHRGELAEALALAEQILALATASGIGADTANCTMGQTLCTKGAFTEARAHFQKVIDNYRNGEGGGAGFFSVEEPVLALTYMSRILWALGYPDRSGAAAEEAIAVARKGTNAVSIATALVGRMFLATHGSPVEEAIARAEEAIAYCKEQELGLFEHWFRFNHGALLAKRGELAAGIEAMEAAIASAEAKKSRQFQPFQLACVGMAYAKLGNLHKALSMVDDALSMSDRTGEKQSVAGAHRMRAEILLALGRAADAQRALYRSLVIARSQAARMEELRTALLAAKHKIELADGTAGRDTLRKIYMEFTEGFCLPDLQAARNEINLFE